MKSRLTLCAAVLAIASASHAAYNPIALQTSSFNADVVVESNATPRLPILTTASIDQGTNNYAATLFEKGLDLANPNNGLPPANTTFTSYDNANYSFKMAPSYVGPNGLLIDAIVTNGTFTLVTPQAYTTLSFLGLGGNGGDTINVKVSHQDGTSELRSFATSDWFGGTTGIAVIMNGRLNQVANLNTETDGGSGDGLGNPRVYHKEITLSNTTSPVTNLVLTYVSGSGGSHSDVMAVSGATTVGGAVTPIAVTGYDYDFVVEASAPQNGRVVSQTIVNSTNVWATDQSLDATDDTGASWYEQGYNLNNNAKTDGSSPPNNPNNNLTGTGLPHPNGFITNGAFAHIYQMPPSYTAADAIYISTTLTNDTITLATPAAFSGLSFLGAAGNGPMVVNMVIHHQGGSSETNILSIPDWYDGSAPVAFMANGRVQVTSGQFQDVLSTNPRLLQTDVTLADAINPITSIYLENTNTASGRLSIFAISGAVGVLPAIITAQPVSVSAYVGTSASFTSAATANASFTYQWQKGTNNVYADLSNGGNISGANTATLTINPVGFADQAGYRLVASTTAGPVNSAAATLTVFSTNVDVTQPGDPITAQNVSTFGDGPAANAIDNNMANKFGANINPNTIAALVLSPAAGPTVVSGLRIYTGNDTTGRDPSSFKLEGSINGGSTYTLITSNSITLPDGRNNGVTGPPNPLTQFLTEVLFNNASGYTTYRLSFPTYKQAGSSQVQFQEIELLGVVNTSQAFFSPQPTDAKAFNGGSATFFANAIFTPTPTVKWLRGNNGAYAPLTDGGNISGSQTTSLSINPATFADAVDYVAVATTGSGSVTSSVAHLYIYTTNTDVSQPGDTIVGFGDTTGTRYGANADAAFMIDNTFGEWINGGSGPSAGAGFAPFGGPVGAVLTPSVGSTVLTGIRFYPGQDPSVSDPSSYILEGSNDGGVNYSTIASGPLSLPLDRNSLALAVDPTQASVQEILFSNTHGYTTYRLTFPTVVSPSTAATLEIGDVEFLGVPGAGVAQPTISNTTLSGGNLHIVGSGGTPSGTYSVVTNASLTVPVTSWGTATTGTFDGGGNFSISLPVSTSNPHLFYQIKTP